MATPKYFCVNDNSNGKSFLIRAMKPAAALAHVVGDQYKTELATSERIYELARAGVDLHESSVEIGTKKAAFFTVKNESQPDSVILIRATSAADAVSRVAGSSMSVAIAEPEKLVELTKRGVEVMDAKDIPAPTTGTGTGDAGTGNGASNDGGGQGDETGSNNSEQSREHAAAA